MTVGNSQLIMPLPMPDARVQSLNLSREKDNKSTTGLSNYSLTLQEKRNAEGSVNQMLLQKGEINEWMVADVSKWLEAAGLVSNAPNL